MIYAEQTFPTEAWHAWLLGRHILPRWGDIAIGDVRRDDVRSWATETAATGLSTTTVRHIVAVLGQVLALAVDSEAIPANPCTSLRRPSPRRQEEMRFLSVKRVEALARAIARPDVRPSGHGAGPHWRTGGPTELTWPSPSGLPLTAAHEAIWAPIGYEGARWRRPEGSRPGAIGAPGTTRTCDTRFRKPLLYPLSYRGMRRIDTTQCPVTLRSVW